MDNKSLTSNTINECSLVLNQSRNFIDSPCSSIKILKLIPSKILNKPDMPNKTNMEKKTIIKEAKEKTNCDTEKCVIEKLQEKVSHEIRKEISCDIRTKFKVNGPTDVSLLNNLNIDDVLDQYMIFYPKFYNYGFNMVDYKKYDGTLSILNVHDLYKRGYRTAACVINSDKSTGRGKHWMALFADMRDGKNFQVLFFNSGGNAPVIEFADWMIKTKLQMNDIIKENKLNIDSDVINVSNIRHQESKTECGVYSLFFIICILSGISVNYFKSNKISDKIMFEWRQHLFDDKKRPSIKIFPDGQFKFEIFNKSTKVLWE